MPGVHAGRFLRPVRLIDRGDVSVVTLGASSVTSIGLAPTDAVLVGVGAGAGRAAGYRLAPLPPAPACLVRRARYDPLPLPPKLW